MPCRLTKPALLAAALLAACGTATPERPARETCGGGACDAIPAGNAAGTCTPPADAQAEDVTAPTTVVGTGTPASCTGDAFIAAVATGGVITFDCGPAPATIHLTRTARVFNDTPSGKVPMMPQHVLGSDGEDLLLEDVRGQIWREKAALSPS